MISEVENITKGLVVSTVEFDTSKKVIGVSTKNLTPDPTGIAPLGKQGAFQVEATETIDFTQAINSAQAQVPEPVAESIELPVLGSNVENTGLKAPVTSDVISENPVQVENPANLTGFDIPNIETPQEETQQEVPAEPVAIDIQMPEMPSVVVADEPSGLNESLFEGAEIQKAPVSILEETVPVQEQVVPTPEVSNVQETAVNIEMPTIPSMGVAEQPSTVENIMETIPTTAPTEEIPAFNIEMPVINNVDTTPAIEPVEPEQPKVEEAAPATVVPTPMPIVEETLPAAEEVLPVVEEQVEAEPTTVEQTVTEISEEPIQEATKANSELDAEDIIKTYKESMEAIVNNFNKAQKELLEEFAETFRKINTLNKKEIQSVAEEKVVEKPVQMTAPVEVPTAANAQIAPGNPLESAAFEIIDAMSAPKM